MKPEANKPLLPEGAEPTAQLRDSAWIPLVVVLLGFMVYWAWGYIDDNSGRFDPLVFEPYASTNQLVEFLPKGESDVMLAKGKTVYTKICAPCHMESGTGDATRFIPPLNGSEWVVAPGPNRLARIVLHGLNGPITVKGQTYGGAAMLAWKDVLNDEDIAAVLTYVRSSWGNKAKPVTPEQVKSIRTATADRSDNWTAEELLKVPDAD